MNAFGMDGMLKQAQQLRARMAKLKEELASRTCEASAGGGSASVTASCDLRIKQVRLKPELLQSGDVAMLEDLVLAASNAALAKAEETASAEMAKLSSGFHLPF